MPQRTPTPVKLLASAAAAPRWPAVHQVSTGTLQKCWPADCTHAPILSFVPGCLGHLLHRLLGQEVQWSQLWLRDATVAAAMPKLAPGTCRAVCASFSSDLWRIMVMPCCAALLRKTCEDMLSSDLQKLKLLGEQSRLTRKSKRGTGALAQCPHPAA